jgi:hypothetical protein
MRREFSSLGPYARRSSSENRYPGTDADGARHALREALRDRHVGAEPLDLQLKGKLEPVRAYRIRR